MNTPENEELNGDQSSEYQLDTTHAFDQRPTKKSQARKPDLTCGRKMVAFLLSGQHAGCVVAEDRTGDAIADQHAVADQHTVTD